MQSHIECFSFIIESLKGKRAFGSCQAAQTAVIKGYKSFYQEARLLFYKFIEKFYFLGSIYIRFDVHCNLGLSHLVLKVTCVSHIVMMVWDMA